MKFKTILLGLLSFGLSCTMAQNVSAQEWEYSIDSFNDSMAGTHVGNTKYEIFGTAIKQFEDDVFFALNTNLHLGGTHSDYAHDKHISWGDILIAGQNGERLGIRWVNNNESGVSELGVYENVTSRAIASQNGLLLQNLGSYNNWVKSHGGTPTIGELSAYDARFNQSVHVPNVMTSGTKIGDIEMISDYSDLGLNFAQFGAHGTYTHVLRMSRSLLPEGESLWFIAPECDNDLQAQLAFLEPEIEPEPVPEPASGLAVLVFGGLIARKLRSRHA